MIAAGAERNRMQKLKIRQGDWVIVCDGKKALILENAGDEKFLNLKTKEVQEHADPKTSDLGTDPPGRSFSAVGSGRSAAARARHAASGLFPHSAVRGTR